MFGQRFHPAPTTPRHAERPRRIFNFLRANPIGVLSTVDSTGGPHGVVIYYIIRDDFSIDFLTRERTRKYDNLRHNNHAMLTVFEPRTQTTAQIVGTASEITDSTVVNGV